MDWFHFLIKVNDILTIGLDITAFALLLYLLFYNRQSRVSRTFSGLLACLCLVYLIDLLLTNVQDLDRAVVLLRLQWLGIAFTPTLYLEFARAIRLTVIDNHYPVWLRPFSWTLSAVIALLALYTDWVVYDVTLTAGAAHMRPGPFFYLFAILFLLSLVEGLRETFVAHSRCYTRAARRRMIYLSIGFIAPAMGVFPYLLVIGWPRGTAGSVLWIVLILANIAIAGMLVMVSYSVAFIGVLTPERIVKHRLVRFLLRGPIAAILALVAFNTGLSVEQALGLGNYTFSLVAMALVMILVQFGVEAFKPLLDLALYRESHAEVAQVQELSQRLLTTSDLNQFLENILAATCELLRSPGGFIGVLDNGNLRHEVRCGVQLSSEELASFPLNSAKDMEQLAPFIIWDGYWVIPIHDKVGKRLLGLMGIKSPEVTLPLAVQIRTLFDKMLIQVSAALEDRELQSAFFDVFVPLLPELEEIQRRRGMLRYGQQAAEGFALVASPQLPKWVHNALSHYWGGPRLTDNPLLNLQIVQRAAEDYDGNSVKGLRSVLTDAIEEMRPDGDRNLTAPEWLLYNILEMKFLRGQKVREVAARLALSESDFYRKQRIAIENLARIIIEMEQDVCDQCTSTG
ncbi:MAG: hypothetical protein JW981_03685 [Anaerolineae bacterium]|nr:hypothetical protein [Anaerolineae bacterium]